MSYTKVTSINPNKEHSHQPAKTSKLYKKITAIQLSKKQILTQISSFYNDFKTKILKAVDKSQKSLELAINTSYNVSLDKLYKICEYENMSKLELQQYERKAQKLLNSYKLKALQIAELSSLLFNKVKLILQDFKSDKILKSAYQFKEHKNILEYSHTRKTTEPLKSIVGINDKIAMVSEHYVEIEVGKSKYTLNKKVDYLMPIKIMKKSGESEYKEKSKRILLSLENNDRLALYSDKLVLNSYKEFKYNRNHLIGVCQIDNYVYVAQKHLITRINIMNLDDVYNIPFTKPISLISNTSYQGMLPIYSDSQIDYLSLPECDLLHSVNLLSVKILHVCGDNLIAVGTNGVKIYKGLKGYHDMYKPQIQFKGIVNLTKQDVLLICKNSQFIHYNFEQKQKKSEQEYFSFVSLNTSIKGIRQFINTQQNLIVLGDNGKKLYFFDY